MDKDVQVYVQSCDVCVMNQKMPEKAPLHPCGMPTICWE